MTKITIKEKNQGERLDKFLSFILKAKTRSQIKKMISNGLVLIDGKEAKVHHFLKTKEQVIILPDIETKAETSIIEVPQTSFNPKIIFEDDNFLILEKPAGMLTHPTDFGETNTLVDWIHKRFPEIEAVGEYKYRGGIIHRLDKDVSGIIVAAKNDQAFYHLKNQFKDRIVKKIYIALVYGKIEKNEGEINLPIGRNKEGQFVAHPKKGDEKFLSKDRIAKTKYKVLKYVNDYSLLEVQILTGRTHQIRAHFQAVGHPILGDQIYKPKNKIFHFLRRKIKIIDLKRIFLHSYKIGFNNLKNEWVEFISPVPNEINEFINDKTK